MGDLISRSALLKILNDFVFDAFDCDGIDDENVVEYQKTHDDNSSYIIQGFNDVYELLEDVPTVDAVPVEEIKNLENPYSEFIECCKCEFDGFETARRHLLLKYEEKVQE